ncbi:unnamed protein product [Pleuronectes platessa]|uniref:Uncharacterized protein n=1 Tax=Pleuronectes platessa TaxID=8262 RepID=A0A9N7Z0M9_PLEPL|nr:unnamed protein product [Pleuronectes platessa]
MTRFCISLLTNPQNTNPDGNMTSFAVRRRRRCPAPGPRDGAKRPLLSLALFPFPWFNERRVAPPRLSSALPPVSSMPPTAEKTRQQRAHGTHTPLEMFVTGGDVETSRAAARASLSDTPSGAPRRGQQ